MSAPVAGRRKGQGAGASASATGAYGFGDTGADTGPSWLTDGSPPAPASQPSAQALAQVVAPPSVPKASSDPLDFLNFDDDVPVVVTAPAVAPAPVAAPASNALDFLRFDDEPVVTVVATPAAPTEPTRPLFTTGNDPYTRPANDALVQDYERLFAQFMQVESDLAYTTESVAALEGGSHEVVRECEMAEAELKQMQEKVAEARRQADRVEADKQLLRQEEAGSVRDAQEEYRRSAVRTARQEWLSKLDDAKDRVHAQRASLREVRDRYDDMQSSVANESVTDTAVRTLEGRLGQLVRTMRSDFGLLVKPLLSRSIQQEMASASQQRADIHRTDAKARRDALQAFSETRMRKFEEFLAERGRAHQSASDALFGELKRDVSEHRDARAAENQRRLGEFRATLKETYRSAHEAVEARLQQQLDSDERAAAQEAEIFATQERQLRERLTHQLDLIRERTVQERSLLARRGVPGPSSASSAGLGSDSDGAHIGQQWRASLDTLIQRARALDADVKTQKEVLKCTTRAESARHEVSRSPLAQAQDALMARKRAIETAFRQSNTSLERWRSAVNPLSDVVCRMATNLQSRRARLAGLHAAVHETRRVWERDVRRELCTSLVVDTDAASGNGLAWPADVVSNALTSLTSRLEHHRDLELQLRRGRIEFTRSQDAQMERLKRAYAESADKLQAVFSAYESVTRSGSQLEAHRIALEAAAEDMEAAQDALQRDRDAVNRLELHIQQYARRVQEMSDELEMNAAVPFQDVTQFYVNQQYPPTPTSDSSHRDGRAGAARKETGDRPAQGAPRRGAPSQTVQSRPNTSSFPPTPSRKPDTVGDDGPAPWSHANVSRSPAHRQLGPRRRQYADARSPQPVAVVEGSPHSVMQSSTTLATDFSTSLIGFDDDDDITGMEDVVAGDEDVLAMPPPLELVPMSYLGREAPSVDPVPQVDQTNFGRSLTTPSSSLDPRSGSGHSRIIGSTTS